MAEALLPFPLVERKVFANNPLFEVVCELRFPTILRVDADVPSEFQEQVRKAFPGFERAASLNLPNLPEQVSKILSNALPKPKYVFKTEDKVNSITLTSKNIAINCLSYQDWDAFKENVNIAVEAFIKIYSPSFFERAGLRYRNIIQRSKLSLENVPWSELLNPMVAGELMEEGWAENVAGVQKNVSCLIPESPDRMNFVHGLGSIKGDEEVCYVLDFDYVADERLEISDVYRAIERLHGYSGSAFQWAISERLKLALH